MEACPVSHLGGRGPERVRALPQRHTAPKGGQNKSFRESLLSHGESLTSPREQQGSGAGGKGTLPPCVLRRFQTKTSSRPSSGP